MADDFTSLIPDLLAQSADSSPDDTASTPANPVLSAQMQQESGGQDYDQSGNVLTSPKGAKGAMQVLDNTNLNPGYGVTPAQDSSIEERDRVGRDYSAALIKHYGDTATGLAAYNWGPGNVDKWIKGGADPDALPPETKTYIKNIMANSGGGQGTQYAQADTGTQTDASPDIAPKDPDQMSEPELDAFLAAHGQGAAKDPDQMSEAELDAFLSAHNSGLPGMGGAEKMQSAPAQQNSASSLIAGGDTRDEKTQNATNKIIDDLNAGKISNTSAALQTYGQGINREFGDNVSDPISNAIPQSVKDAVSKGANFFANTYDPGNVRGQIAAGVGQAADYANKQAPVTMGDVNALGNIAKPILAGLGAEAPLNMAVDVGKDLPGALGRFAADESNVGNGKLAGSIKNLVSPAAPEYDADATHLGISKSYGDAKAGAKPYYNLLNQTAQGEYGDVTGLKPALQSMITDIENSPFHEAKSELPYLKQQLATLGDGNTMPLNDVVKLKQSLNSNFNPGRFANATDSPYATLSNVVDSSLKDAAQRIPEFGKAKVLADRNWLNTVKKPFEDNPVLEKFWKPDDFYNQKNLISNGGNLEELPDETKGRAAALLKNIKTPTQLDAVRRVLPQDLSDKLSQAKIADIAQNKGTTRMGAVGKTIKGAPNLTATGLANTTRNVANIIKPNLKQADKDLIAAAKAPKPTLSNKYQAPFQNLKAGLQQQNDLAGEMQPVSYAPPQKPMLQLPAPDMVTPPPGNRDEILRNIEANRPEPETLKQLPPPDKMSSIPLTTPTPKHYEAKERMKKLGLTPDEYTDGFKKGGMVKESEKATPKFTHRQWTGYLQSAGKANGHTLKDKNNAAAQKKAYETVSKNHSAALKKSLGRDATVREVELAHYVTPQGVVRVLKQKNGTMPAHKMFPSDVVKDMRKLFFNKNRPYSVDAIRKVLS